MPDLNGLRSIKQLSCLNDSMLENLLTITNIIAYKAGDYIFKEGDDAKSLYAVIDGKVGLEIEKNSSTRILIDNITQGMMLGFSASGFLRIQSSLPGKQKIWRRYSLEITNWVFCL
ncbi:MAG: cyclic nucleotide-binding domain-containing protein [Deltaproteobacteria bacterium]|nr:cyclic nucleotide-binding domain-containing protein [Deltaproteobacteria bacterium]